MAKLKKLCYGKIKKIKFSKFSVLYHTTKTALNLNHSLEASNTSIVSQKNLESQKNVINLHITSIF